MSHYVLRHMFFLRPCIRCSLICSVFLQYLQSRVLQGLLVPDKSVGPGSRLIGSFALTSMFLKFLGLRKAMTSFCWWICLVEQDLPRISQFLATIGRRP